MTTAPNQIEVSYQQSDRELATCRTGCTIPAIHALPAWLKKNDYTSPTEGKNSPFSLGFKTDLHFFEFLSANPEYPNLAGQFNNLMSAYHQGRASWMDPGFYPVQDNLIQGARTGTDEVFLVDVGGNKGHDLEEFKSKWPEVPGRLILQDQPHVLAEIRSLNPAIEVTAHDFFTEQPVKGRLSISPFSFFFSQSSFFVRSPGVRSQADGIC